jgi:Cu(I)/Ag(I) efflux system membrane protein CusA/SilA
MIERIIEFSANHKAIVLTLVAMAALGGLWQMGRVPLDALPDLSDTQVIVYSRWDRSPDVVEDQITYPIVTAMLGGPKVKAVRGFSDFGYSYVYVIFQDGTDLYWARSRVMEYLSGVLPKLPQGVKTELGPDATGLGWVYQYALVDRSGKHSLDELRSYQDWYLRYYLKSVPGVAEVASLGGHARQYQVNVDPNRLRAYGIPMARVVEAVRGGNNDSSGRLIEFGGTEYMVRSRGYVRSLEDLENTVLAASEGGTPIRIKDIGQVELGADLRRGVTDLDGKGEAVSGIVVMRQGENAVDVIERVKGKLNRIAPGLPEGVRIEAVYDRSDLIQRAIRALRSTLLEVVLTVALVVLLFLWHVPSSIVPIITIPVAVLIAFLPFGMTGLTANIMSLGGIGIAIGALVDASIVVVEQVHKKLECWERAGRPGEHRVIVLNALKEVGGPSFFALLVLGVSFFPVLALEAQEGRLFRPLAYTKILCMVVAAILGITLDPALRLLFTRTASFHFRPRWLCRAANTVMIGRIRAESGHPVSRLLIRAYQPIAAWSLRRSWTVIAAAAVLVLATVPIFQRLGTEFMPPLDEGTLLYMPSTLPGISIGEAQKVLQVTDRIIRQFPEVDRVMGKAGRAETPTDPAPLSMLETIITLKPKSQWRRANTWYSSWAPEWARTIFRHITPDLIGEADLIAQLDAALKIPGLSNAWTMPVKGRIDMLTTGIRTAVGLKIYGADVAKIESVGARVESLLASVPGARRVFAERAGTGYFLDVVWDREALARYGLTVDEADLAVRHSIGGDNVTTTVEGRARYPVNVRYQRDFRSDPSQLARVLVTGANGQRQVPLSEVAAIRTVTGPAMIRDEDGLLTGYVFVDLAGRDPASFVAEADRLLSRQSGLLPPGYSISWSGQHEALERVRQRLKVILPLTLFVIIALLYANTRSVVKTAIILLAVPFSAIGAFWFLYALGYNMSAGVWVGLIALLGVDAETGVFMLLYLDLAYEQARREGRLTSLRDLHEAILEGAVKRIRPKAMTVMAMAMGLAPIMWSTGVGADVMKRIAAPLVGGIFTSFALELIVYPAVYRIWKWNFELMPVLNRCAARATETLAR